MCDETDLAGLKRVVEQGPWSGVDAPDLVKFERDFAAYQGARHAVAASNGTITLEIALRALGVGAGDEVIVPPYTFLATATAVLGVNALPVFADISPDTYCLDPAAVEAAIGPRTAAVIAVHLGGHAADLDRLGEICARRGLALTEDCAHAHGARWRDRPVGTYGAFGSWSFQASKNLTAGEGGALTSDDDRLADIAREIRHFGRRAIGGGWYEHHRFGGNYRMTALQAALLNAGLQRLPAQVAQREECAEYLDRELATVDGISPLRRDPRATVHAHHLYLFRYSPTAFGGLSRDDFCAAMQEQGVPVSAGYPMPLYRQPVFARAAFDRRATGWHAGYSPTDYDSLHLPVAEAACAETVWLPHNVLLAPTTEMADVIAAIEAVRTRASSGAGV